MVSPQIYCSENYGIPLLRTIFFCTMRECLRFPLHFPVSYNSVYCSRNENYDVRTVLYRITVVFFDDDLYAVFTAIVGVGTDGVSGFYNTILNVCIVAQIYVVQNNRILDHAVISHIYIFK